MNYTQKAEHMIRLRQKDHEENEIKRRKLQDNLKVGEIESKFAVKHDAVEEKMKAETVGLVTLEEMKKKREELSKVDYASHKNDSAGKGKKIEEKIRKEKLSFAFDDFDDDDEEDIVVEPIKKNRVGMCPDVDTSFLPDRERDEKEAELREQLAKDWREKQEALKEEDIEVIYSYWDGTGHRRQIRLKKGFTIQQFIQKALEQLRQQFADLKGVSSDQLMYVKSNLIIPQYYTFYQLVQIGAHSQYGLLFDFKEKKGLGKMQFDMQSEKDETQTGKLCLRSWYDKSKHYYPASRWEPFDEEKYA